VIIPPLSRLTKVPGKTPSGSNVFNFPEFITG
jgi:hypothetical protein